MPIYTFKCADGDIFEKHFSMASVPDELECSTCGQQAARIITSVRLSRAGSPVHTLLDQTARSAHEPEVVSSLPGAPRKQQPVSQNPLHRKLPKP